MATHLALISFSFFRIFEKAKKRKNVREMVERDRERGKRANPRRKRVGEGDDYGLNEWATRGRSSYKKE